MGNVSMKQNPADFGEVSEANYLHTKKEISGELQGRSQAI